MKHLGILSAGAVALLWAGCSEQKPAGDRKMSSLAENDVFLRVNGVEFKKHDFQVASTLFDKMARMRGKDALTGPNAKAERSVRLMSPYVVSDIKRRALMGQFAKENKIEASEKNVKEAEALFLKSVDRKKATVDEVAAEIGGEEGALLKAYLKGDAVDLTMREKFDSEKTLEITDADIMVVSNRWKQSFEISAASNKIERTLLEKAIAEIKAGKDFVEVAKTYSLNPEDATEWAELDQDDIAEEKIPLTEWVKTAKVGDVSGIFELEDGFAVVKVVGYEKDEDDDPNDKDADPPDETWTLVRICRKSWQPYEPMTREEIVSELFKIRSRKVQKKIGDAIMAKAVIEWPYGTNLFEAVETKRPSAKREKKDPGAQKKAASDSQKKSK